MWWISHAVPKWREGSGCPAFMGGPLPYCTGCLNRPAMPQNGLNPSGNQKSGFRLEFCKFLSNHKHPNSAYKHLCIKLLNLAQLLAGGGGIFIINELHETQQVKWVMLCQSLPRNWLDHQADLQMRLAGATAWVGMTPIRLPECVHCIFIPQEQSTGNPLRRFWRTWNLYAGIIQWIILYYTVSTWWNITGSTDH
jgi:hypothetical protein